MIGGLRKGNDFEGLLRYLFHGKGGHQRDRGRLVGGTALGNDMYELALIFNMLKVIRPDICDPVRHLFVSSSEGECLSDDQWLWVAEKLTTRLGLDAWTVVQHQGRCEHIHIVGSRVTWNGSAARERLRDYGIVESVMREAELRFKLRRVTSPARSGRPHGRTTTPGLPRRSGSWVPIKDELRKQIQECKDQGLRRGQFFAGMKAKGFETECIWTKGRPTGIIWVHTATGRRFSGRSLGPEFKGVSFFQKIGAAPGRIRHIPEGWPRGTMESRVERAQRTFRRMARLNQVPSKNLRTPSAFLGLPSFLDWVWRTARKILGTPYPSHRR